MKRIIVSLMLIAALAESPVQAQAPQQNRIVALMTTLLGYFKTGPAKVDISDKYVALPDGEYKKNCEQCYGIEENGKMYLKCRRCSNKDGTYSASQVLILPCKEAGSSISYISGKLKCIPPLPDGKYLNSCEQCSVTTEGKQKFLKCLACYNVIGKAIKPKPLALPCESDTLVAPTIGNDNGELYCTSTILPRGNYHNSCHGCGLHNIENDQFLICNTCINQDGNQVVPKKLQLSHCTETIVQTGNWNHAWMLGDIYNHDGTLKCGYQREDILPSGDYQQYSKGNYEHECRDCSVRVVNSQNYLRCGVCTVIYHKGYNCATDSFDDDSYSKNNVMLLLPCEGRITVDADTQELICLTEVRRPY